VEGGGHASPCGHRGGQRHTRTARGIEVHDICDRCVLSGVRIIMKAIADAAEGRGLAADLPHVFPGSPTRENPILQNPQNAKRTPGFDSISGVTYTESSHLCVLLPQPRNPKLALHDVPSERTKHI
jgi:hypothetical protein